MKITDNTRTFVMIFAENLGNFFAFFAYEMIHII